MTISIGNTYTSSNSGTIQLSGLTSETDWTEVIDKLIEADSGMVNQLTDWEEDWSNKITCLSELNTLLLTLNSTAEDIGEASSFYSYTSTSSDEDVLTVSYLSGASAGSHTVTVGSNVPHKVASQGWADSDTTGIKNGDGDFVISVGEFGSITIDSTEITGATTLQDLCDLINNDSENTGDTAVVASIIDDGSNSNQYRLELTAVNGGPDYTISITENPTGLNFYQNDIAPPDVSNLSSTTTTTISTLGSFSGDKNTVGSSGVRTYTFTGPETEATVGSGDWTISWSGDNGGGSGTINLGSDYTPGDTIEIEDGVYIQFDEGVFEGGSKTFTVKAFSTDIDDTEMIDWNGTSSVTSGGNYLGSTSKTFTFTVSGSGSYTVGTDDFAVTWTDTEGNSGTIEVTSSEYTELLASQGVEISFGDGTVSAGDTFSIDVFSATIQDNISEGLAKAEVETHSGFADEDTTAVTSAEGTFTYTYGGVTRTITVSAGSTLADLQDLINNDDENPGVTASIINDGSGLSTAYHLQLTGNDLGADYTIENISHALDNFDKGGTTGFGFSETQSAQNAMIKVDGYPSEDSEYIQRTKNTIGDVISGVTLRLAGSGTSTITVASDVTAIEENIQGVVDAVNSALDYIAEETQYDESGDGENSGTMIGNYAFQLIKMRINSVLTNSIPGLVAGEDAYTYLSEIGIHTDPDDAGRWTVDSDDLLAALNNDLDAVAKLFITDEDEGTDGVATLIADETDALCAEYTDANPGIIAVLIENYQGIIDNIEIKIDNENYRLEQERDRLTEKFTNLETALEELSADDSTVSNFISQMNKND